MDVPLSSPLSHSGYLLLKALLRLAGLLCLVSVATFVLLSYSPIDPIKAYIGNDLLHVPPKGLPSVFSYAMQAEHRSRLNTPPTFAIYVTGLMLRWIRRNGGLEAMAAAARDRSRLLYDYIDGSRLFKSLQRRQDRSAINVCFQLADTTLVETFLQDTAQNGLANLAGHTAVGGVRASLYNAMPVAGVRRLVSFMTAFERQHG